MAVPNAEVVVVRPDGSLCQPDEEGELVHRGAFVTLGYLNRPAASEERFRPWSHQPSDVGRVEMVVWSGDIVRKDFDGYLYYVGRRDEMIKTSGHRVSPGEIEAVLMAHPRVRRAAAFGVPDERLGQHIVAFVEWHEDGQADLGAMEKHCLRELPKYMVPKVFHCIDEMPLNTNGKIDRVALRGRLTAQPRDAGEHAIAEQGVRNG